MDYKKSENPRQKVKSKFEHAKDLSRQKQMKEYQTPLKDKDPARSSENANRRSKESSSKKSHKITKKTLNATFEDSSETSRDSLDFSAISEISDANHKNDFAELMNCLNSDPESFLPEDASSETLLSSDLAPSSKDTTDKSSNTSANRFDSYVLYASAANSDEAEIAVNFLRKAQSEILNSANVAPQYQKLLDEMIKIVIQELCTLPKERDSCAELLSKKKQVLFLSLLIWIIGVSLAIFFTSDVCKAFKGPLPT